MATRFLGAVSGAVQTLVIAGATFAAGWYAKHTPRPDLRADPVDVAVEPGAHALDGRGRDGNPEQPVNLFDPPHRP
jgi:hypothetical protein